MLSSSSPSLLLSNPYVPARRLPGGVCQGSVYCHLPSSSTDSNRPRLLFCRSIGCTVTAYESLAAYDRGDAPLHAWEAVGSGPCELTAGDHHYAFPHNSFAFRIVTKHSTDVACAVAADDDRTEWLSALQTGLERSLLSDSPGDGDDDGESEQQPGDAVWVAREKAAASKAHRSAGSKRPPAINRSFFRSSSNAGSEKCTVCHKRISDNSTLTSVIPIGYETRQLACTDCGVAEGLLRHLSDQHEMQTAWKNERKLIEECRRECRSRISVQPSPAKEEVKEEETPPVVEVVDNTAQEEAEKKKAEE